MNTRAAEITDIGECRGANLHDDLSFDSSLQKIDPLGSLTELDNISLLVKLKEDENSVEKLVKISRTRHSIMRRQSKSKSSANLK
jgi:hypothetical protein